MEDEAKINGKGRTGDEAKVDDTIIFLRSIAVLPKEGSRVSCYPSEL